MEIPEEIVNPMGLVTAIAQRVAYDADMYSEKDELASEGLVWFTVALMIYNEAIGVPLVPFVWWFVKRRLHDYLRHTMGRGFRRRVAQQQINGPSEDDLIALFDAQAFVRSRSWKERLIMALSLCQYDGSTIARTFHLSGGRISQIISGLYSEFRDALAE